jgi:hypothetical protein
LSGLIDKGIDNKKVKIFDSTTFTLIDDAFTGTGRNKMDGKKKKGIKAYVLQWFHEQIPAIL